VRLPEVLQRYFGSSHLTAETKLGYT